ncbi:transcription factor HES-1-like [Pangasianodon hypophthalmus]|uniref:transcription factor HES-1-like n=1 Tax=Pangasianodon hypophthalmus TaxID=310915 RepID=UPI00147E1B72|nr:transcription factor HES-1-like [Pangasianodon hypophthalmus]
MSDYILEKKSSSTLLRSNIQKLSKPLMEKRRRARINRSLSRLKSLLLQTLHKHTTQHAKLEKADILELTVKHIRNMQQKAVLASYRAGYSTCARDVAHFLAGCECVSSEMRVRLLAHLARCLSEMNIVTPPATAACTSSAQLSNYKTRTILFPAVMTNSVFRDILMNNGMFTPLNSSVVHVNLRGQLWRPW